MEAHDNHMWRQASRLKLFWWRQIGEKKKKIGYDQVFKLKEFQLYLMKMWSRYGA
jgi:hypothetical protein